MVVLMLLTTEMNMGPHSIANSTLAYMSKDKQFVLEITGDLSQRNYFLLYHFLSCRSFIISFLCHQLSREEGGLLYLGV